MPPALPTSPFPPIAGHALITEFHFIDRSDEHAELTWSRSYQLHPAESSLALTANLIAIESPETEEGFLWLRLAPSATVRSWDAGHSLKFTWQDGHWQASRGVTALPYEEIILRYQHGAQGRTRALHAWQRARHPRRADRDGLLLSNTWGDRSRADKLSEAFVFAEIERAAQLGVEVVQLDDGWQRGRSANTVATGGVWDNFWATAADYWTPDPDRFPHGLATLCAHAQQHGVKLGLWYAPDSSDECLNWEKDAALLLQLWREHGITHFKLDAVKLRSALCEMRFRLLLDRLAAESSGAILIDLDTTAESRLGFWGRPEGASIFVENRYTDWGNYYPHSTLRTLWSLTHTVLPARLRMEFLNHERNRTKYNDDPLQPAAYSADYLFASVMIASPLAWFEITGLSTDFIAHAAPLIALWKNYRHELHTCDVLPLGQSPNGYAWTGFALIDHEDRLQHLLLFREKTPSAEFIFELPRAVHLPSRWQQLAGAPAVHETTGTQFKLRPDRPQAYCWLRGAI